MEEPQVSNRQRASLVVRLIGILLGSLAVFLSIVVYVYGWWLAGSPQLPLSAMRICWEHPVATDRILEQRVIPLSGRCYWADGTSTQLVPAWVNPVSFTLLGLGTIGPVIGIRLVARKYGR
jgi:hypothetical protein